MNILYIDVFGDLDATSVGSVFNEAQKFDKPDHVIVGINSEGGDITAGYAIRDLIRHMAGGAPIHTLNCGDVSSAALDIYMMGDYRYGTDMCEFTIHRGYIEPDNKRFRSEDLKEEIPGLELDDLKLFNETLADTKLPKTLKNKLLAGKDVTLDRRRAKRYKIINTGGLPWTNLKNDSI